MSGITTRSAYGKLQKPSSADKDLRNEFYVTGQPVGSNRRALDVVNIGLCEVTASVAVESGSNDYNVKVTGHGAKVGDMVKILTSANSIEESEVFIDKIVDANNFELASLLSASLVAGDTIGIYRPVAPKFTSDGETLVYSTNYEYNFLLDGVPQQVTEDTVTPANNRPLPVKLTDFSGDVSITANQINMNLDDTDDSVALGDGNGNIIGITGSTLKTEDTVLATAVGLLAKLTDTQPVSAASLPLPTGAASEATLSSVNGKLPALSGGRVPVDGSGVTQPISAASLPLPTGAASDSSLGSILSELQNKADLSETQPVSVASLPLPSGASTSANQSTMISSLSNIDGDLGAIGDAAVTNPASNASVISALKGLLTLIASTNTKLDTLDANTSPSLDSHSTQTVTSAAAVTFTAPAGATRMVIQNSLNANGAIRFVKSTGTPTASDGFYLGVGQSTSEIPAGSFKAIATTASEDGDVSVLWFV